VAEAQFYYILVQDGCDAPLNFDYTVYSAVTIPVQTAVLASTSELPYLEILGLRNNILGMAGFYTTSECTNKRIVSGQIISLDPYSATGGPCTGISPNVSFGTTSCSGAGNTVTVQTGDVYETKLLGQLEWLNFFALFFNKEASVGTYVTATESAMSCVQSTVQTNVATRLQAGIKPAQKRVLWGTPSYTDNDNTWASIGSCPNYYCDAVTQAGGIIVNDLPDVMSLSDQILWDNGNQITGINATTSTVTTLAAHGFAVGDKVMFWDSSYSNLLYYVQSVPTTTTVVFESKTAGAVTVSCNDYGAACSTTASAYCGCKLSKPVTSEDLLYAAASIDVIVADSMFSYGTAITCLTYWLNLPADMNAFANRMVYDTGKIVDPYGGFEWYSSRYALVDVVVTDLANIMYPALGLKTENKYMQNVFTEGRCKMAKSGYLTQAALGAECTNPSG
jgi:hypothetical protein